MNWISENKFLSGFIGFMVVGVAALGFLLFQAISNYAVVHDAYTKAYLKLDNLQKLKPYPNDDNLKRYQAQEDDLAGVIGTLEQNLAKVQFPLDTTVTPNKFQDKLRAAVSDEVAKAKANNIELPDKFALGFDQYLTTPPVAVAAPGLDRELRAMVFVFDELLDGSGVLSIGSSVGAGITRSQLAEEKQGGKPSTDLVVKNLVQISFVCDQNKLRKILNDLVETQKQFFIVRLVHVGTFDNMDKPINKQETFKTRTQKNGAPRFVLGDEKLEVTLSLEIVNFNPPQK